MVILKERKGFIIREDTGQFLRYWQCSIDFERRVIVALVFIL